MRNEEVMDKHISSNINKTIDKYFNSFMEENIGGVKCKILPPKNSIPSIKSYGYDPAKDRFEILFKYEDPKNIKIKKSDFVLFIENKQGELLAIQILNFKKHNVSQIRLLLTTTIDNEIKQVQLFLEKNKENVSNAIIEKRKLSALKEIIQVQESIEKMSKNETGILAHEVDPNVKTNSTRI
jgi:hypothetical protein